MSEQIARFYESAIEDGRVPVGDRLPPIREVASTCSVTRATVQDAYRRLADRGLVEGTVGRGTVVLTTANGNGHAASANGRLLSPYAEAALRRTRAMAGAPALAAGQALVANFAELQPDDAQFPIPEWRAAMDSVLEQHGRELLAYGHSAFGRDELRELLAQRMQDLSLIHI